MLTLGLADGTPTGVAIDDASVAGLAPAGATVSVKIGSVAAGSAIADVAGQWQLALALAPGSYAINASTTIVTQGGQRGSTAAQPTTADSSQTADNGTNVASIGGGQGGGGASTTADSSATADTSQNVASTGGTTSTTYTATITVTVVTAISIPLALVWDTGPSSVDNSTSQTSVVASGLAIGVPATFSVDGVARGAITPDGAGGAMFDPDPGPGAHVISLRQATAGAVYLGSIGVTCTAPYSTDDFLGGLLALLPTGPAWPKQPGSNMVRTLRALVPVYNRNSGRAVDLLGEAFPSTTRELLPEWETSLGLSAGSKTIADRQGAVVARLVGISGPSISALELYAAHLGYEISIAEGQTFRPGVSAVGPVAVGNDYAPYTWYISAPGSGQATLQPALQALSPDHTQIVWTWT